MAHHLTAAQHSTAQHSVPPMVKAVSLSQTGIMLSVSICVTVRAGREGLEAVPEGCSLGSNMSLTVFKCLSVHSHRLNLHSVASILEFESIVETGIKVNANITTLEFVSALFSQNMSNVLFIPEGACV